MILKELSGGGNSVNPSGDEVVERRGLLEGDGNFVPEESHKREDIKVSRHTERKRSIPLNCVNNAILRVAQEDETKHVIVSESETIQPIDNQNQLQGVDMRSNSSPQRGEEAIQSEQTRALGVQVRGEINSYSEEQHLQSEECRLKTQAVCKTFQPNVDTFNANVVIGERKYPVTNSKELLCKKDNYIEINNKLDCFGSKEPHNDENIHYSRHSECNEESHNREDFTNNAILRGLNCYSPLNDCKNSCCLTRGDVHKTSCKVASTLAEGATHVAHWKNSRKIAFTLAEVLITLGIIGVVAALTLPALISQYQDKVLADRTRKVYSEFQNGLMLASQTNDTPGDFSSVFPKNVDSATVVKNLAKSFSGAKVCTNNSQNGCQQFYYKASYTNPTYKNNGEVIKSVDLWNEKIILADGVIFYILSNATGCDNVRYTGTYKNNAGEILYNEDGTPKTYDYYSNVCANIKIDVNGVQGPNQYGRDLYHLWVYQNKVVPATSQKDLGGDSLNNILSGKDKLIYTKY